MRGSPAPIVESTPRERSDDVQDLGMWQVWQEQPAPPEMSSLELPRERSRPRRWWILGVWVWMRVQICLTSEMPFMWSCYQQQQGQSGRKPQFPQSTFAAVVAEEAAKLHAQLGQDAIDVPTMKTGNSSQHVVHTSFGKKHPGSPAGLRSSLESC